MKIILSTTLLLIFSFQSKSQVKPGDPIVWVLGQDFKFSQEILRDNNVEKVNFYRINNRRSLDTNQQKTLLINRQGQLTLCADTFETHHSKFTLKNLRFKKEYSRKGYIVYFFDYDDTGLPIRNVEDTYLPLRRTDYYILDSTTNTFDQNGRLIFQRKRVSEKENEEIDYELSSEKYYEIEYLDKHSASQARFFELKIKNQTTDSLKVDSIVLRQAMDFENSHFVFSREYCLKENGFVLEVVENKFAFVTHHGKFTPVKKVYFFNENSQLIEIHIDYLGYQSYFRIEQWQYYPNGLLKSIDIFGYPILEVELSLLRAYRFDYKFFVD